MKKLFVITVILILSGLQFGCGKSHDKAQEEQDKVVFSYFKALESGNIDEAVAFYSKDALQELEKTGGKQPLATAFRAVFAKRKGIKAIKVTKRDGSGETAKISFDYEFNDGSSDRGFLLLVKEDGKWKISK